MQSDGVLEAMFGELLPLLDDRPQWLARAD
jgi:hypothetical protein